MKKISKEKFSLMYAKYTLEEIAKKLGVSKSLVEYYARKLNLKSKRKLIIK